MSKADDLIKILLKDIYNSIQNDDNTTILSIEDYDDSNTLEEIENKYYALLEDNTEEIEELNYKLVEKEVKPDFLAMVVRMNKDKINELVKAINSIRKGKSND